MIDTKSQVTAALKGWTVCEDCGLVCPDCGDAYGHDCEGEGKPGYCGVCDKRFKVD